MCTQQTMLQKYYKDATEIEGLQAAYPTLSPLDLHYFSMKYYGVRDSLVNAGRPSWNLIDSKDLYHITFATDEVNSPYMIREEDLFFMGKPLPFRIDFVERIPVRKRRYYYLRNSNYLTPTLFDEMIINLNFQQQCYLCNFCQNLVCGSQRSITEEEGFQLIMSRGDISDLGNMHEIAVVTGCFWSGDRVCEHIIKIIDLAVQYGFKGRLFYIGFELIESKLIKKLLEKIQQKNLKGLKMAYTIEKFSERNRLLGGCKGKYTLDDIVNCLKLLKDSGITELQYSYIPGLDTLDDFKRGAERLASLATPHISIYRPFQAGQREKHVSGDYLEMGPKYLCEVRTFYEALYSKKLYGNNLGNIFPFPLSMISKKWVEGRIVGEVPHLRYWQEAKRPTGWRIVH